MAQNLKGGLGGGTPGPLFPMPTATAPPTVPPTPPAPAAPPAAPPAPPAPPARRQRRAAPAAAVVATPAPPVPPAARPARRQLSWAWVGVVAPHVPVVLTGLLMLAVVASTWRAEGAGTTNWVREVVGWAWRHAQPLAVGLFAAALAYAYTDWRGAGAWLYRAVVGGWSGRVVGFYAAGLAAGAATMLFCLEVGGDSRWMMWVGVFDMAAVVAVFALLAHWRPHWDAPPAALGGYVAALMLLVPGWLALCNLAAKF